MYCSILSSRFVPLGLRKTLAVCIVRSNKVGKVNDNSGRYTKLVFVAGKGINSRSGCVGKN